MFEKGINMFETIFFQVVYLFCKLLATNFKLFSTYFQIVEIFIRIVRYKLLNVKNGIWITKLEILWKD